MLLILRNKKKTYKKMLQFNKQIARHLKRAGIKFDFASFEDIELFLSNRRAEIKIKGKALDSFSTIYPRKVGHFKGLAHALAQLSKKKKICFIDTFHQNTKDSSDTAKIIQMLKFSMQGVPIPKTYYSVSYSRSQLKEAAKFLGFPIVIKQCNTSQGAGVFLAKNKKSLEEATHSLLKENNRKEVFLQEFIPNSFEFRFLVTGGKIGSVEKKIRTKKNEFRNNVHLGAIEEFISISSVKKDTVKAALAAARVTQIQICGVDVIEKKDGKPVVFEANSCPGITLDESVSNELKSITEHLIICEKK